jgi:hypothetical protein
MIVDTIVKRKNHFVNAIQGEHIMHSVVAMHSTLFHSTLFPGILHSIKSLSGREVPRGAGERPAVSQGDIVLLRQSEGRWQWGALATALSHNARRPSPPCYIA